MAQALNWNQLIEDLQRAGEYGTISQLYAGSAEEAGNHFEGLRETIRGALQILGQDTGSTEAIFQTAPFNVAETSSPRDEPDEERIKEKGDQGRGDGIGGPLIDHDKYESGILDNLHEDNLHNATDELDKIRNREGEHANLTDEQIREKTAAKFEEILTKNSDGEQAVQDQQQALIDKLKQQTEVDPQVIAELEESKRRTAAMRNKEREKRAEEMEKMRKEDDIERIEKKLADAKAANPRLRNEKILTNHELSRYNHYDYLRSLQERGNISDIASWRKRFAECKTPEEQNRLLRQLLYRQHRDNRFETRQIFNKEVQKRNFFTRKMETRNRKIMTRKQRRNLLDIQRQKQQKHQARTMNKNPRQGIVRKLTSRLSQFNVPTINNAGGEEEYEEEEVYEPSQSQSSGGGFSPIDTFNNIRSKYNDLRRALDFAKKLGDTGEVAEAGEAIAGGAGGVGGIGGILAAIGFFLLFLFVLFIVILLFYMAGSVTPTETVQIQCESHIYQEAHGFKTNLTADLLKQYFGIYLGPYLLSDTTQNQQVDRSIFLDTCILFGYQEGTVLSKGPLNTFGTLTVGTLEQRSMDPGDPPKSKGEKSKALLIYIDRKDDINSNICYMQKETQLYDFKSSNRINWYLTNPTLCSPYRLQFLLAQTYAYTLLEQQRFLKTIGESSTDILQKFKTEPTTGPGVINADHKLPTNTCQSGNFNVKNYADPDSQQVNCFVDMVGEYATYPFYVDIGTPVPTPSITATPTP